MTAVTVLVVHGSPRLAEELTAAGIEVVGVVTDAREVLAAAAPQVVVVDLAGADALTAVGLVSDDWPGTAVLVTSDEPATPPYAAVLAAVRAGATGYVAGADVVEIADAVRRLAKGGSAFDVALAGVVLEASGDPHGSEVRLTEREADVLRFVVEGLTARQIAGRLTLSPRTVENHVQHLLRKLDLSNRAALVRYAIEHGLA